ncbi:MAG: DUF5615 family PIN-like protein [Candidatus Hydrogenedentes bacterium]|nr:DUF5615 family PIN-like protein [Candidatus Hydrogenedentota bacterium]
MRLLIDQDVYVSTERFLLTLGHDVVTARQLGLQDASDETLLRTAAADKRILVTRDRDFGALVFVRRLGRGVLYLRMRPTGVDSVHIELARVLRCHHESELANSFVVIESGRHRIRRTT